MNTVTQLPATDNDSKAPATARSRQRNTWPYAISKASVGRIMAMLYRLLVGTASAELYMSTIQAVEHYLMDTNYVPDREIDGNVFLAVCNEIDLTISRSAAARERAKARKAAKEQNKYAGQPVPLTFTAVIPATVPDSDDSVSQCINTSAGSVAEAPADNADNAGNADNTDNTDNADNADNADTITVETFDYIDEDGNVCLSYLSPQDTLPLHTYSLILTSPLPL